MTFIQNIVRWDAELIRDAKFPGAVIGEPQPVHKFTVKFLKEKEYVGLYWP